MLQFVNAKINLGLRVLRRRPDGYHDLETIFVPVGIYAGTHGDPDPFCDILEILPAGEDRYTFTGNKVDCPLEKNLVWKAVQLFRSAIQERGEDAGTYYVHLDKHLPDGAGMGGGSADATFVLRILNDLNGCPFSNVELAEMALKLGADCPVFVANVPAIGEGVGEQLKPVSIPALVGKWLLVVKPDVYISTKEAFAGVTPRDRRGDGTADTPLEELIQCPIEQWRDTIENDFEQSVFPQHPELRDIKQELYKLGAQFALMTGSGSSLYGIFCDEKTARDAQKHFAEIYSALLKL